MKSFRWQFQYVIAVAFLFTSSITTAATPEPIEINVYGNHALSDETILKITGLDAQPLLSTDEIKKRLETSGLFSMIRVVRYKESIGITVVEKTMWFALPYFSIDSASSSIGVAGGKVGILGENASLLGRLETGKNNKKAAALVKNEFFLESDFLVGGSIDYENTKHLIFSGREVARRTDNRNLGGSFQLGHQLRPALFLGLNTYAESHKFQDANLLNEDGVQISHRAYIDFGRIYLNEGLTTGAMVRTYFERTSPWSEFSFYKTGLSGQGSPYLAGNLNWIIKPKFEFGNHLPYYQRFEVGGPALRGFSNQQFRDDTYFSIQNDVLITAFQIWGVKLRPLAYLDWAFIENSGRTGIGGGMQAFLRNVAMPAVQIFAGYGFNPDGFSVSAAVGPQF